MELPGNVENEEDIFDFLLCGQKTKETNETPPISLKDNVVKKKIKKLTAKGKFEILKEITLEESLMVIRFSYCKRYIMVGLGNGLIKMFSVSTGLDFADLDILCEVPCTDIAIIPPLNQEDSMSKFAAVYSNGLIAVWDFLNGSRKKPQLCFHEEDRNLKEMNHTLCCSVSGDCLRIATGGDGSVIRILSLENGELLMRCFPAKKPNVIYGKQMRVSSLKYDPRGRIDEYYSHVLYSASWENCIYIWHDDCCSPLWRYKDIQINGIDGFDICVRTNEIIAGNWSNKKAFLKIWNFSHSLVNPEPGEDLSQYIRTVAEYHQIPAYLPAKVYVALSTPDGEYILYGGWKENMLVVLERDTFRTIGSIRNLSSGVLGADYANCLDDHNKISIACITANNIILLAIPKAN